MKIVRTTFVLSGALLMTISAFGYFFWYKPIFNNHTTIKNFNRYEKKEDENAGALIRIRQKATQTKEYIANHGFDTRYCFFIDMRIPSGKNRFFVYNLENDAVEKAGLVTHGSGSEIGSGELSFSNIPNSYSTSLGKYKIGKSYHGSFGLAYKLYGQDNTNSKAFNRFIVLHAHDCVPNDEVYPYQICLSQGCPTVSPEFLSNLKMLIEEAEEPILLWIYY